ncbi:MAG: histidinol dehydrogenase, partial [Nitrospinota bacterium]|nr:histidinol dehydrogenase [Nitrospinota bacterium]
MKIIKYSDDTYPQEIDALVERCDVDFQSQDETVRTILAAVKKDRDEALLKFTNQFDHTDYQLSDIEVQPEEIQEAYNQVDLAELDAMKLAASNIERFHARQVQESWEYKEDGVTLGQAIRPLSIVGIYVPGGKASYPSSVLMNAI